MEILNFEVLKNKIKNYYSDDVHCQLSVICEEEKIRRLSQVFKNENEDENKNRNIGLFKIILSHDITIFEYESTNASTKTKSDNIVVTRDNKPIFKMERDKVNPNLSYQKESFSIYDENSKLVSSICLEKIVNSLNVNIINKGPNEDGFYSKKYTFYSDNAGVVALRVDDEMHLIIENGFIIGVEAANHLTEKISNKIKRRLDETLGLENMKEYKIRRKKQGK